MPHAGGWRQCRKVGEVQPTSGVGKRMHSPSYRLLSGTVKETYFTAGLQCVAELYAHDWKREWGGEEAIGFVKEINTIRALRDDDTN